MNDVSNECFMCQSVISPSEILGIEDRADGKRGGGILDHKYPGFDETEDQVRIGTM